MAQIKIIDSSFRQNKKGTLSSEKMADNFNNCFNSVKNMIVNDGPIYHTWISFQLGRDTDAVIFNTDTQNPRQNVISSLTVKKSGAGSCNEFTLNVVIDPFNFGQETQNQIERLDELLAVAISKSSGTEEFLTGYIQYGYISTSDDGNLISPLYEFILTDANSTVNTSSGISNYTFKGTSYIAMDCNFKTSVDSVEGSQKVLDTVVRTLYKYYGDPSNKPEGIDLPNDPISTDFKYRIDCAQELLDDSATFEDYGLEQLDAQSDVNPIQYCQSILEKHPLTKSDLDSGEWDNWESMNYNSRPRYDWWITDENEVTTIHITHYNPNKNKASEQKVYYLCGTEGVTWGLHQKNVVVQWEPKVDLKTYLLQKSSFLRLKSRIEAEDFDITKIIDETGMDKDWAKYVKQAIEDGTYKEESAIVQEHYDAVLTLVGIPSDVPIGGRIIVIPRILESVSRTKGTYFVKGATDTITNQGVFTTALELFRVDDDKGTITKLQEEIKARKERETDGTAIDDFQRRDEMLHDNGVYLG